MKSQAGSIGPAELREVASLVKAAGDVIDQMVVLNQAMDKAAASAVSHYKSETRFLVAGATALQSDRENLIARLTGQVAELEALVLHQRNEIAALRELLSLQTSGGLAASGHQTEQTRK